MERQSPNSNHGYYCCVPVCRNRSVPDPSLSFHTFPSGERRADVRRAWIHAIRREEGKDFKVTSNTRVCSAHFKAEDYQVSSYANTAAFASDAPTRRRLLSTAVPSVFPWRNGKAKKREAPKERTPLPPRKRRCPLKAVQPECSDSLESGPHHHDHGPESESALLEFVSKSSHPASAQTRLNDEDLASAIAADHDYTAVLPGGVPLPPGVLEHIRKLQEENQRLKDQSCSLLAKSISLEAVKGDDEMFSACTGLPDHQVFQSLCEYLQPKAERMLRWRGKATAKQLQAGAAKQENESRSYDRLLTVEEEFFAVLYRLRTGASVRFVARQLGINQAQFSFMFTTWINFLSHELEDLIKVLTAKAALRGAASFKDFADTRMVIDCTEIFSERPSGLKARQQLFSNYKHHNTVKFLVGCSTNGSVTFVSSAWQGRTSDKKITCDGCLDVLSPGDAVMADRGFLVEDELKERGC